MLTTNSPEVGLHSVGMPYEIELTTLTKKEGHTEGMPTSDV